MPGHGIRDHISKAGAKPPRNASRIVVEGIDDRPNGNGGRLSDRIKIDPFSPGYKPPVPGKTMVNT